MGITECDEGLPNSIAGIQTAEYATGYLAVGGASIKMSYIYRGEKTTIPELPYSQTEGSRRAPATRAASQGDN